MLSQDETHRLAAAANALRPDWPVKSLITFIGAHLATRTYRETAVALAYVATDPQTQTPKRVLEAGPWWESAREHAATVSVIPSRCHHGHKATTCPTCASEQAGNADAGLHSVKDALRNAPRYVSDHHTRMQRLAEQRTQP